MKKTIYAAAMLVAAAGGIYAADFADLNKATSAEIAVNAEKAELPAPIKTEAVEKVSGNFKYECFGLDENGPYGIKKITLEVYGPARPLLLSFAVKEVVTETYFIDALHAPKPGASNADSLYVVVKDPHYDAYSDSVINSFYIEKQLMNGGYKLKNGKMGGFIKTTGWGYSWAGYICTR